MIFLKPIDEAILAEVKDKYAHVVTVEDGTIEGGLGSAVSEWLSDKENAPRLTRLGIPDEFVHQGTVAQLKHQCGIDAESIADTICKILNQK